MDIGLNIKKYRTMNNITQEEFAYRIDISKQTVYKWESNISIPNCDKALIICKVLNITLDQLFE